MHSVGMTPSTSISLLLTLTVIENAVACKAFRDLKLDLKIGDEDVSNIVTKPLQFNVPSMHSSRSSGSEMHGAV